MKNGNGLHTDDVVRMKCFVLRDEVTGRKARRKIRGHLDTRMVFIARKNGIYTIYVDVRISMMLNKQTYYFNLRI